MGYSRGSTKRKIYRPNTYIRKEETSEIKTITLPLKELEKEEQIKPTTSRIKEILKARVQINQRIKQLIWRINEIKSWFLEKINEIGQTDNEKTDSNKDHSRSNFQVYNTVFLTIVTELFVFQQLISYYVNFTSIEKKKRFSNERGFICFVLFFPADAHYKKDERGHFRLM